MLNVTKPKPGATAEAARLGHVDCQRDRGDGNGPRRISGRRDIMAAFANRRLTQAAGVVATVTVLFLNTLLLPLTFGVRPPFLS
jgi:hypothetical protein